MAVALMVMGCSKDIGPTQPMTTKSQTTANSAHPFVIPAAVEKVIHDCSPAATVHDVVTIKVSRVGGSGESQSSTFGKYQAIFRYGQNPSHVSGCVIEYSSVVQTPEVVWLAFGPNGKRIPAPGGEIAIQDTGGGEGGGGGDPPPQYKNFGALYIDASYQGRTFPFTIQYTGQGYYICDVRNLMDWNFNDCASSMIFSCTGGWYFLKLQLNKDSDHNSHQSEWGSDLWSPPYYGQQLVGETGQILAMANFANDHWQSYPFETLNDEISSVWFEVWGPS